MQRNPTEIPESSAAGSGRGRPRAARGWSLQGVLLSLIVFTFSCWAVIFINKNILAPPSRAPAPLPMPARPPAPTSEAFRPPEMAPPTAAQAPAPDEVQKKIEPPPPPPKPAPEPRRGIRPAKIYVDPELLRERKAREKRKAQKAAPAAPKAAKPVVPLPAPAATAPTTETKPAAPSTRTAEAPLIGPQPKPAAPAAAPEKKPAPKPKAETPKPAPKEKPAAKKPAQLKTPKQPKEIVEKATPKEAAGGTPLYSVRVGYSDSKNRTDTLCEVLTSKGFPEAKTMKDSKGYFYVHAGEFKFRNLADGVAKELEGMGLDPVVHEKTVAK